MSYLGKYEQRATNIKRFDVTSSTSTTHTLTWVPVNEQSLFVTINGVKQQEDAYSVSGAILTLTDALISTDKMEVIGIQDIGVGMVPADGVVKNVHINDSAAIAQSKLATLAIDTAELADDAVTADKLANAINTSIAANTAKVTNATHTGDVTGATALTIAVDAVDIAMLSATGSASATTFLRGDNAWSSPASGLNLITSATNNSAVSSWDFVDCFSSTYRVYLVQIAGLVNVTGSQETRVIIGVSDLSSVESFGFSQTEFNANGNTYTQTSSSAAYIDLNNTMGGDPGSCNLYIYNPFDSAQYTQVIGQSVYYHTGVGGNSWGQAAIGGTGTATASSVSLQLASSSGNIGSASLTARVSIYGLAES